MASKNDLAAIENEALKLSNFDGLGGYEDFDGYDDYDGFGDDFVQFDDNGFDDFNGLVQSFANEIRANKAYICTISNTNATAERYIFSMGYEIFFNLISGGGYGQVLEGTFLSLNGQQLQCSGQPSAYTNFWMFAMLNPTRVLGFKLYSTDISNHEQVIEVERLSPYKKLGTRNIYVSTYKNEYVQKDNITTVKEGFDFNNQSRITGWIAPNSSITYTFVMGSVLNTAAALGRKRKRAKRGAIKRGKPMVGFAD